MSMSISMFTGNALNFIIVGDYRILKSAMKNRILSLILILRMKMLILFKVNNNLKGGN